MKHLLSMIILFASTAPALAGEEEEGKAFYPIGTQVIEEEFWQWKVGDLDKEHYGFFRTTVAGDTTINDMYYKRALVERCSYREKISYHDIPEEDWEYDHDIYLHEDSGKVYFYREYFFYHPDLDSLITIKEEKLIYDFNWEVGKELPDDAIPVIDEIKTIQLRDGNMYDYIECPYYTGFSCEQTIYMIRTIGRVGELSSIFESRGVPFVQDLYSHVASFERNGVEIYSYDDYGYYRDGYFNASLESITETPQTVLNRLYDLQGRRLLRRPAHGVYIKDGRKYVVK